MTSQTPLTRSSSINPTGITQLVRQARNGCRTSFGQLFDQFHASVYAVTFKYSRNKHTAEELCQDVFIRAMEKLDQLRQLECFGPWLKSIARRMTINHQQRATSCVSLSPEMLSSSPDESRSPSDSLLAQERQELLQHGLQQLGSLDRDTLVAFYLRHQSLAVMSDEFDAPLGTIKRRLHVARKRLAEEINPRIAL